MINPTARSTADERSIILDALTLCDFDSTEFIDSLYNDIVQQSVPILIKHLILQESLKKSSPSSPKISLAIALCVSLTLVQNPDSLQKGTSIPTAIRRELVHVPIAIMLDVLHQFSSQIPIDVVDEWRQIWQIVVYLEIVNQVPDYSRYQSHPFISSFFATHPHLKIVKKDSQVSY